MVLSKTSYVVQAIECTLHFVHILEVKCRKGHQVQFVCVSFNFRFSRYSPISNTSYTLKVTRMQFMLVCLTRFVRNVMWKHHQRQVWGWHWGATEGAVFTNRDGNITEDLNLRLDCYSVDVFKILVFFKYSCLLWCGALQFGRYLPTFRRNMLLPAAA